MTHVPRGMSHNATRATEHAHTECAHRMFGDPRTSHAPEGKWSGSRAVDAVRHRGFVSRGGDRCLADVKSKFGHLLALSPPDHRSACSRHQRDRPSWFDSQASGSSAYVPLSFGTVSMTLGLGEVGRRLTWCWALLLSRPGCPSPWCRLEGLPCREALTCASGETRTPTSFRTLGPTTQPHRSSPWGSVLLVRPDQRVRGGTVHYVQEMDCRSAEFR